MTLQKKLIATLSLPLFLNACFLDEDERNSSRLADDLSHVAVVATRAADYSSGAHALVSIDDNSVQQNLDPTGSDIAIRADGDVFYRIGRYGTDTVTRYASANPDTPIYTYSTQDPDDVASSNPYDIISVEDNKAYLLRYGAGKMWIVNPSAATEGDFKTGEIDLTGFDADGVPEMAAATEAAGLLFVVLQRLSFFDAVAPSLLVAIDISTDEIVDLDPNSASLALELPAYNASAIQVRENGAELIILADGGGSFSADYSQYNPRYDGGIVQVSLADFSTALLLDDGTEANAPYGQFMGLAELQNGQLWLLAGDPNFGGTQSLFAVDEATQSASNAGLPADTQNQQVTTMTSNDNELWMGVAGNSPQILRFNPATPSITTIPLELVPLAIDFAETRADN